MRDKVSHLEPDRRPGPWQARRFDAVKVETPRSAGAQFNNGSRPLVLQLGDEERRDAGVVRVRLPGIGKVGLVAAGTEFLLKGHAHDGRMGGVLLLLADA